MVDIESLRKRYVALNGTRPTPASALSKMEALAGLPLPPDFRAIAAFFDGDGLYVMPMFSFNDAVSAVNPVDETARLRASIGLPDNWLVLGEPPASLLIMDCAAHGRVVWLDAVDASRIGSGRFMGKPDVWDSFSDFFAAMLDEEEEERAGQ
jgi:hypothetical protein